MLILTFGKTFSFLLSFIHPIHFSQITIKDLFNDKKFLSDVNQIIPGLHLSSANSINWARFLPQVVFTINSYLQLVEQGVINLGELVDVCIPTGNFGNMLGAVFARQLGLPVRHLITASNENNVIADFIRTGSYDLRSRSFQKTISPSIDILISSNLERFLYLLTNGNYSMIQQLFNKLAGDHYFNVDSNLLQKIQSQIQGDWTTEDQCVETMKKIYHETQQLIDPHTAVAVNVAEKFSKNDHVPMLISATAHYGKFPQTVLKAIDGDKQSLSSNDISILLKDLQSLKSTTPMHHELIKLPNKSVVHTNTVKANKLDIIKEINIFLEKFSKQHLS
jgi:threonine synthase